MEVDAVQEGGAAARAGVQVGDKVGFPSLGPHTLDVLLGQNLKKARLK
jgi:hypothetical protein